MNNPLQNNIPASALGYSITFLLLIGMICSGVLFLSSTNKRLELNYEMEEHLIFDNFFSLNYGASQSALGTKQIIHPNGDTSIIVTKNWGMLKSIVATTFHKNRKIVTSALSATETDHVWPALYLPDHRQELKLCGETLLEGSVYTSERGLARGNIANKRFSRSKLLEGKLYKSERYLPALKKSIQEINTADFLVGANKTLSISNDSTYSFSEKTTVFIADYPISINNRIEGNIIIQSLDSIIVEANAQLENVILLAPLIRFKSGFIGTIQAIASKHIICETEVKLNYPSSLILNEVTQNLDGEQNSISIEKDAQVLGGVLLISQHANFRKPIRLAVFEGTIGGLVYNQGETELRGKIIGSLYTNSFKLRAGGGVYGDHLMDATVSIKQLPKDFIMPDWLKDVKTTKSVLLTCF